MAKEPQSNQGRIVAVDILRLMSAIIVMYGHLYMICTTSGTDAVTNFLRIAVARVSPVFFLLAGYFACRNPTWRKACNNAWWCLAPFALWNSIAIVVLYYTRYDLVEGQSFLSLFGLTGHHDSYPVNIPLWFMRDLSLLFLISPVLYRISRYIFPVFLFLSVLPVTSHYLAFNSGTVLSMNTVAFFMAGCYLRTLGKELQERCLSYYSPAIVVGYFGLMFVLYILSAFYHVLPFIENLDFIPCLVSILVLYQAARWLEAKCPKARLFALRFAPVTFLTFAGHLIIYMLLPAFCRKTACALLLPLFCFGAASALFFALKRWCRPLLHLVAHYKLRAEDVQH